MRLDIEILRTFVTIAQVQSFARAAERLNLSPSAVSWQIRKLEDQTGSRLFNRNNQMVAMTPHGSSLLGYANRLLHLHDEAVAAINPMADSGRLTLGVTETFISPHMPTLLRQFRASFPRVSVNVEIDSSLSLRERWDRQDLDMILRRSRPGEVVDAPLLDEPLHWVAADTLEWNAGDPLPLVVFPRECANRYVAEQALKATDIDSEVVLASPSLTMVRDAIQAGIGIGVLAPSDYMPDLKPFSGAADLPQLENTQLVLDYDRDQAVPPLRALADLIRRHVTGASGSIH